MYACVQFFYFVVAFGDLDSFKWLMYALPKTNKRRVIYEPHQTAHR